MSRCVCPYFYTKYKYRHLTTQKIECRVLVYMLWLVSGNNNINICCCNIMLVLVTSILVDCNIMTLSLFNTVSALVTSSMLLIVIS